MTELIKVKREIPIHNSASEYHPLKIVWELGRDAEVYKGSGMTAESLAHIELHSLDTWMTPEIVKMYEDVTFEDAEYAEIISDAVQLADYEKDAFGRLESALNRGLNALKESGLLSAKEWLNQRPDVSRYILADNLCDYLLRSIVTANCTGNADTMEYICREGESSLWEWVYDRVDAFIDEW